MNEIILNKNEKIKIPGERKTFERIKWILLNEIVYATHTSRKKVILRTKLTMRERSDKRKNTKKQLKNWNMGKEKNIYKIKDQKRNE